MIVIYFMCETQYIYRNPKIYTGVALRSAIQGWPKIKQRNIQQNRISISALFFAEIKPIWVKLNISKVIRSALASPVLALRLVCHRWFQVFSDHSIVQWSLWSDYNYIFVHTAHTYIHNICSYIIYRDIQTRYILFYVYEYACDCVSGWPILHVIILIQTNIIMTFCSVLRVRCLLLLYFLVSLSLLWCAVRSTHFYHQKRRNTKIKMQ